MAAVRATCNCGHAERARRVAACAAVSTRHRTKESKRRFCSSERRLWRLRCCARQPLAQPRSQRRRFSGAPLHRGDKPVPALRHTLSWHSTLQSFLRLPCLEVTGAAAGPSARRWRAGLRALASEGVWFLQHRLGGTSAAQRVAQLLSMPQFVARRCAAVSTPGGLPQRGCACLVAGHWREGHACTTSCLPVVRS